jgi:DNA-binding GntR family transcriptional regulator
MPFNELTSKILVELSKLRVDGDGYISENELAARLAIGRPQLREILAKINTFGMITKKQKYGIRLRLIDAKSHRIMFDLREMLEGYVAAHLDGKLTESDFAELEFHADMNERGFQNHNAEMMAFHDLRFHQILLDKADMALISNIIGQLSLLELAFIGTNPRYAPKIIRNPYTHKDIIAALRRSNCEGAEILRKHIHWIADNYDKQQIPEDEL